MKRTTTNLILFQDHLKGEGILVSPQFVLMMRFEKGEVPLSDLTFESKTQTNQLIMSGV